jgi:hypothetical protein
MGDVSVGPWRRQPEDRRSVRPLRSDETRDSSFDEFDGVFECLGHVESRTQVLERDVSTGFEENALQVGMRHNDFGRFRVAGQRVDQHGAQQSVCAWADDSCPFGIAESAR